MKFLNMIAALNGGGDGVELPPDPSGPSIFDTFGANLKFFYDTEDASKVSLTGTFNNEITSAYSSDASNVEIISLSGQRTIWNGHSVYTRGLTYLYVPSSLAYYNFLHEASASTIAFRIYIANGTNTTSSIFNNNNNQASQRGIRLIYQSGNINMYITKGTSGQVPISAWGPGGMVSGQWYDVIIEDTGSAVTVYIDGVAGTTVTNAYSRGVGNAGFNMTMFRYASSGSLWATDICIKNPMFVNRLMTSDEKLLVRNTYLVGTKDFGEDGVANVYGLFGQSNASGRGTYSGSPAYFDDPTGAMMWNKTNATPAKFTNYWAPHQFGVNCSTENQNLAGPDIEFAYRMNIEAPNTIYILKYATTGSSMKPVAFPDKDWYYLSDDSDNCYHAFNELTTIAIKELKYEQNKDVRIKGFMWRQGESDTAAPNEYYGPYFEAMLTERFKLVVETLGYTVADCRIVVSSLDMFNATRPDCHVVVDACQDTCDNATDLGFAGGHQFSTIGRPTSDGTHLTLAGQISDGYAFYDYLKNYL